jgi:hypothetical protein
MDIEQFYDADPRRRHSEEISYGRDWTDDGGTRWELNWVADTGELYLMREPVEPGGIDPVGDTWVPDMPVELVTVEILGVVSDRAAIDRAIDGWDGQMRRAGSLAWARDQLAGLLPGHPSA